MNVKLSEKSVFMGSLVVVAKCSQETVGVAGCHKGLERKANIQEVHWRQGGGELESPDEWG